MTKILLIGSKSENYVSEFIKYFKNYFLISKNNIKIPERDYYEFIIFDNIVNTDITSDFVIFINQDFGKFPIDSVLSRHTMIFLSRDNGNAIDFMKNLPNSCVSFGLSELDTVTLTGSNDTSATVCIQREIVYKNCFLELQEYNISINNLSQDLLTAAMQASVIIKLCGSEITF